MCISLDSSLEVFCARCANSAVLESWSGFLPKRHTKWPFLATVSLATLHLHLSLLSHKVMHYSIPKWSLFDHFDLKITGFHYMSMLSHSYPLLFPVWLPFQRTNTIDLMQRNIHSFPCHPHYLPHAMQVMHAHAMLVMHKNAQNAKYAKYAKYGYAMLFTHLS